MQSLSTEVSADDGWRWEPGSDRRSLRLHFRTPAYHFFQQLFAAQLDWCTFCKRIHETKCFDLEKRIFTVWEVLNKGRLFIKNCWIVE